MPIPSPVGEAARSYVANASLRDAARTPTAVTYGVKPQAIVRVACPRQDSLAPSKKTALASPKSQIPNGIS
ncbi:MAG: hypothetical protein V7K64_03660 [Nostoc sp.]|uniref:hypothetical protein n=1 Tax=Nostoc sp. TaxID=1180 RepID=UPI001DDB523A|nr:hypothetical protein [Nostoc sp. JL34]